MPPRKINFNVCHSSGEDELHPFNELNTEKQGPMTQGWASSKFCLFPNDLIIQFEKKIVLRKVQLLSHQYLIASKIEFYIGDCPHDDVNHASAKYTRLGYVELSANDRTDFRARELKSVHVDAEGTFLKFVLHKNFVNRQNLYNQVGLIAINVIGIDVNEEINRGNNIEYMEAIYMNKRPDYISPLDDLAFVMYQDPEISKIIRSLDKKKCDSVRAERFDEAKRLKQAISELYKIGERLARYDLEKRQAIEDEDYEKAKQKKLQMTEYRSETYRQLKQNNLMEYIQIPEIVDGNVETQLRSVSQQRGQRHQEQEPELSGFHSSPRVGGGTNRSKIYKKDTLQNDNDSHKDIEMEKPPTPYDDRVIPTLRHNNNNNNNNTKNQKTDRLENRLENPLTMNETNGILDDDTENIGNNTNSENAVVPESGTENEREQEMYDPIDGTEEMTEREVREAALMNDILGKQIVTKLYSKNFQTREDAIDEVYNNLFSYKGEGHAIDETKALFRAAAILVAKMSKDNVFMIFNNSLRLFQFLLNDFSEQHAGIGKSEMNYAIEKCLPVLLHRTGDTNARLRQRSLEYIVEMASYIDIKPLGAVPAYLTIPIKAHTAPRLALSQCEIIEELMQSLGIKDNGLNVDNVSKFCAHALEHTSGEVRELTTKILIQLYQKSGSIVRKYLPQDNEMNRRNKKYRILFDAFDGIDGKPIQSYAGSSSIEGTTTTTTPRFNQSNKETGRNVKTPNPIKSKTPRSTSVDRKTPLSMADESEYNPDNTCMFCGEVNEKFVKQGFEMHYWKSCPMLKQCSDCKQVIEVAVQTEHFLTECQFKNNYKKCSRCTEAVNVTSQPENEHHFKKENCQLLIDFKKGNRCPLCHTDIGAGEEVWKDHLMGHPNGCTKNNRIENIQTANTTTNPNSKQKPPKK